MKKPILLGILIFILFLSGCNGKQEKITGNIVKQPITITKFVCPNGSIVDNKEDCSKKKGWCNIQVSPDGKIKYCSDIHGDHFDYCNGRNFYTWVCSTKEDVEKNKVLFEDICISVRNTCSEGKWCRPQVSPIACS